MLHKQEPMLWQIFPSVFNCIIIYFGTELSRNIRNNRWLGLPMVRIPGKYLSVDCRYCHARYLCLYLLQSGTLCRFWYKYILLGCRYLWLVFLDVGTPKRKNRNSRQAHRITHRTYSREILSPIDIGFSYFLFRHCLDID